MKNQLATAFARLSHKDRSAPEDVQAVSFDAPKPGSFKDRDNRERGGRDGGRNRREEFDESIWFTISVGRKQNAEPRWLIPLLCKSGDITKADIGVIKMQQEDTLIQLDAAQAESFFEKIGPNQTIDKNIKVKRLPGKPKEGAEPYVKPSGGGKKWDDKPRRKRADKDGSFRDKPPREKLSRNDTFSDTPKDKKPSKSKTEPKSEGHELHTKPPLDMDALGKKPFKKKAKNKAALKEGWAKKKTKSGSKSKSRKPSSNRDTGGGNQGLKRKKT